jgi:hypothetical protein
MEDYSFISKYIVSISPLAETFLEIIAQDYDLPINDMKKRYLYQNKKTYDKILKKHKTKKTRKIHAYNIFLSDKNEMEKLLKKNNTDNQTKINKQKGELWDKYRQDPKIIKKYERIATMENKGLLTKNYRKEILTNYDKYHKQIKTIINDEDITTLTKSLELLNLNN